MLSITGVSALQNTQRTVLNAVRPVHERYKGASLKSNLIRVTPMTLNLPLSNYLSYCYNLPFFHEGSLGAFHILVKCSWSQSLLKVPLIMSLLWCKIELLLQCMLYPGKVKPFPQLTELEGLKINEQRSTKSGFSLKRQKFRFFFSLFLEMWGRQAQRAL